MESKWKNEKDFVDAAFRTGDLSFMSPPCSPCTKEILETSHQKTCQVIIKAISRQNEKHAKIIVWFNLDLVALEQILNPLFTYILLKRLATF